VSSVSFRKLSSTDDGRRDMKGTYRVSLLLQVAPVDLPSSHSDPDPVSTLALQTHLIQDAERRKERVRRRTRGQLGLRARPAFFHRTPHERDRESASYSQLSLLSPLHRTVGLDLQVTEQVGCSIEVLFGGDGLSFGILRLLFRGFVCGGGGGFIEAKMTRR